MNKITNRQVICETLVEAAKTDKDIFVLASDSRGSASMATFFDTYPENSVELGIAEQNIVGVAAGLAHSDLKPFVTSPACFLSMRSIEQIKVDVAYSNTNVKLIGISGGISYGALGMSHHSVQDIAVVRAIPNMTILIPADRHETKKMTEALVSHVGPTYVRIGRNAVEDVYKNDDYPFEIGKAITIKDGFHATIIACGELVSTAVKTAELLAKENIFVRVINMHTIKPLDEEVIIKAAKETPFIVTLEEHSIYGGLGAAVAEVVSQNAPVPMKILGIPDEPAIAGKSQEVFDYYGLSVENVSTIIKNAISKED